MHGCAPPTGHRRVPGRFEDPVRCRVRWCSPRVTDLLTPPPRDRHIELRNLNHVAQTATEPAGLVFNRRCGDGGTPSGHHRSGSRWRGPRGRDLRARLDRSDRGRPGPAPRHRGLLVTRPGPGLPDQPVQDHDRAGALHRREVLLPRRRRPALLPAGRRPRSGHHPRAPDRTAPPPRLDHRLGHRGPPAERRRMRRAAPAGEPRQGPRRPPGTDGRPRQGGSRRRGADPPGHRARRDLPRPPRSPRRDPDRRRGHRRPHRPGRDPRRHRRVLRRDLGPEDRPHGRHEPSAHPARPPARLDRPGTGAGRARPRRRCGRSCATRTPTSTTATASTASASVTTATARCPSPPTTSCPWTRPTTCRRS